MTNEEIQKKASEFMAPEAGQMYITVAMLNEWQKETGGTLDEYLEYMDKNLAKKSSCRTQYRKEVTA